MLSNFALDPFRHVQSLADMIRRDVENSLNRSFETWDVLEHSLPDDKDAYYRMTIKTDDNGHVKVKTIEKEPGKDWDVSIEEYDRGKKSLKNSESPKALEDEKSRKKMIKADSASKTARSDRDRGTVNRLVNNSDRKVSGRNRNAARGQELARVDKSHGRQIQSIADSIKDDVESMLNETFRMFDVFEHTSSSNRETPNYNMKIRTDNEGGHVRVNAAPRKWGGKGRGKDWDVRVQEYNKGKAARPTVASTPVNKLVQEKKESPKNDKIENKTETLSKRDTSSTKVASHDQELSRIDKSLNDEIQSLADFLRHDVESMLSETFKMFDVFEHTTTSSNQDRPNYNMKIRTDDKGGHVQVNATPNMEANEGWDVHVQEYDKDKARKADSPKTNDKDLPMKMPMTDNNKSTEQLSNTDTSNMANKPSSSNKLATPQNRSSTKSATHGNELVNLDKLLNAQMQSLADFIKNDVESILERTFKIFDVFGHSTSSDRGKTSYGMDINVDDGGHMKVKATPNESGKDWDVHVEEYDQGKAPTTTEKPEERTSRTANNPESQRDIVNITSEDIQGATAGEV